MLVRPGPQRLVVLASGVGCFAGAEPARPSISCAAPFARGLCELPRHCTLLHAVAIRQAGGAAGGLWSGAQQRALASKLLGSPWRIPVPPGSRR